VSINVFSAPGVRSGANFHGKEVTSVRNYELAFIIEPNMDEEGATGVVERVSQLVESIGGKVASVDVWGRRQLAYPINNHREGTYVLLDANMPPSGLVEFERNLKLTEPVIRYLLLLKEGE
jgi:small subunit ribosomal protein S6